MGGKGLLCGATQQMAMDRVILTSSAFRCLYVVVGRLTGEVAVRGRRSNVINVINPLPFPPLPLI